MGNCCFRCFSYIFLYIRPFGSIQCHIFFFSGETNHTNLTRSIDPRHPEPPYSPISPKISFSFFRFLGFGGRRVQGEAAGEGSWTFSSEQASESSNLGYRLNPILNIKRHTSVTSFAQSRLHVGIIQPRFIHSGNKGNKESLEFQ